MWGRMASCVPTANRRKTCGGYNLPTKQTDPLPKLALKKIGSCDICSALLKSALQSNPTGDERAGKWANPAAGTLQNLRPPVQANCRASHSQTASERETAARERAPAISGGGGIRLSESGRHPSRSQRSETSRQAPAVNHVRTFLFSARSEEHTSELQSPCNLVCRLLLE